VIQAEVPMIRLREAPPEAERRRLAGELAQPEAVAALAWQRELRDLAAWRQWLDQDPARQHDPFLLPDMDLAVDRIRFAREHGQKVLIHGDYDVDGLTGTALLRRALRELGIDARAFVPHRGKDGYGLSRRALDRALADGYSLLVTVDCGSSESAVIEELALKGMDTVVTDHHLATDLPESLAFVSPMRPDSEYPFPALCGSAIAYKLARALCESLGRPQRPERWLDYAALGTVADVMPLTGENRVLVAGGLKEMSRRLTARPGSGEDCHPAWRALARVAGLRAGELSAQDLAFRLAPRLNAPGRLGSARVALELLCADSSGEAVELAERIETINTQRRELEAEITASARQRALARREEAAATGTDLGVLALAGEGWHPGVLGISAARLTEEFGLPTILAGLDEEGQARGSGRGPEGSDLKGLLDGSAELLLRYGGHRRAVGFTVDAGRWAEFAADLEGKAPPIEAAGPLMADLELGAEELTRPFLDGLEALGPFGEGNPEPRFLVRNTLPLGTQIIKNLHLRLEVTAPGGETLRLIAFGRAEELLARMHRGVALDICFTVSRDTFQRKPGEHGLSLQFVEFCPSGSGS
jgi:single-stranded-DNA-specific exonuclease